MSNEPTSAGDSIPDGSEIIAVRVSELKQLFNAIDPSPFREHDLDPQAESFIVEWARELHRDARLALKIHLDRTAGPPDEAAALRDVIHEYFAHRANVTRRRLRQLFRFGRASLVIGLAFLATAFISSHFISTMLANHGWGPLLREAILIGGWVAMWRPLEVFLYEWWPIWVDVRLYRRLSTMPVQIIYGFGSRGPEAWRDDWPSVPVRSGSDAVK